VPSSRRTGGQDSLGGPSEKGYWLGRIGGQDSGYTLMIVAPNRRNEMNLRVIPTNIHGMLDYSPVESTSPFRGCSVCTTRRGRPLSLASTV
jgi:hypothetical protein